MARDASSQAWWRGPLLRSALRQSLFKLDPRDLVRNPVMAVTAVAALAVSVELALHPGEAFAFRLQVAAWLWFTVLFANFAEALAEGRGRAQAEALRSQRADAWGRRLRADGDEEKVPAPALAPGDRVVCEAGDLIPADGEVVDGVASIDESAITGESAPVIRESGGDRSAVTGGTRVLSDRIVVAVTAAPGQGFLDRMIGLVEGANRQKTPNEKALGILLVSMTAVFLLAVGSLPAFAGLVAAVRPDLPYQGPGLAVLAALFVCLIPTTIGGLLSAIGISGIDRLVRQNVLATSGRAVEAAGDIDVLLLDKTGTITFGNRMAVEFLPAPGVQEIYLAEMAQLASIADETPEGRSVVILAKDRYHIRSAMGPEAEARFIEFSAQTRLSGIDCLGPSGRPVRVRKGAAEAVAAWVRGQGGTVAPEAEAAAQAIARQGGTPLLVGTPTQVLGVIHLKDVVKGGIRERFDELRRMGIRTVMVTGDNPLTAAAIAAEAGVDDFLSEATPEMKLKRIREEQAQGRLVAMTGDGTNDAPALAQADVGMAMNTGTQAAREAGNMVDLDSNPTKLIEVVETGKQLLITRGALTTFSTANDVAKYFAILPALFGGLLAEAGKPGPLQALNVMRLASPQSAILSAVIFNALVILALIPLALRGVAYRPGPAASLLRRNLAIYGLGGMLTPFLGIKLIDLALAALHWA